MLEGSELEAGTPLQQLPEKRLETSPKMFTLTRPADVCQVEAPYYFGKHEQGALEKAHQREKRLGRSNRTILRCGSLVSGHLVVLKGNPKEYPSSLFWGGGSN